MKRTALVALVISTMASCTQEENSESNPNSTENIEATEKLENN